MPVAVALVRVYFVARVVFALMHVLLFIVMPVLVGMVVMAVRLVSRGLRDQVSGQHLHAARRAVVRRVADDLRVHRADVGRGRRGREELHSALRAAPGLVADDLGVHRASVGDRPLGHLEVHLGDERERLVGLGADVRCEPLPLGSPLRVVAHDLELLGCARRDGP
jgi:hypothetical protein